MPAPSTTDVFLDFARKSGLVNNQKLSELLSEMSLPAEPHHAAALLVQRGLLTKFQAQQLMLGRHKGFVIGQLKILDQLGVGGMGAVYLCEHMVLNRKVAVKVLPQKQAQDEVSRERFYREARAAAALDHPNIVRIHDASTHGDLHYLVMEYVDGKDLQELIKANGALPIKQAVGFIIQAAAGLHHAHERGLVHRDIKPSNLLVEGQTGLLRILDMGLARFFKDSKDNLTQRMDAGAVVGTIDYLAPEQAMESSSVDARADIYSLGATLYALLTGQPPFGGTTTQKLLHHQVKEPAPLSQVRKEVPEELAAVISKMMAKNPDARFQTPAEVITALAPWSPDASDTTGHAALLNVQLKVGSSTQINPAAIIALANSSSASLVNPAKIEQVKQQKNGSTPANKKQLWVGVGIAIAVIAASLAVYFTQEGDSPSQTIIAKSTEPATPETQPSIDIESKKTESKKGAVEALTKQPPEKKTPPSIYQLELKETKPVSIQIQRSTRKETKGEGKLPEGWTFSTYNPESTMEAEYVPATKKEPAYIKVTNLVGDASSMIFTPPMRFIKGHRYLMTYEYQTEIDGRGSITFWDEKAMARQVCGLANTKGKWTTGQVIIEADSDADRARFEFFNTVAGKKNYLSLRKFDVRTLGPASKDPKPRLTFFDASTLTPAKAEIKETKLIPGEGFRIPPGMLLQCWNKESVSEISIETRHGEQALALRNISGMGSFQLLNEGEPPLLPEGKKLRVVVRYQAEEKATGEVQLRPIRKAGEYTPGYAMRNTSGFWRTVEFIFENRSDDLQRLYIQNLTAGGPNSTIWISKIEVFDETDFTQEYTIRLNKFGDSNPFSFTVQGKDLVAEMNGTKFKENWQLEATKADSVVQAESRKAENNNLLGLLTVDGTAGFRLLNKQPLPILKAGHVYVVRCRYLAPATGKCSFYLRDLVKNNDWQIMQLPQSDNRIVEKSIVLRPTWDLQLGYAIGSNNQMTEPLLLEEITLSERPSDFPE